jgi:hypothetical protein
MFQQYMYFYFTFANLSEMAQNRSFTLRIYFLCKSVYVNTGVEKKFHLKNISLIVGLTYRGLSVLV